MTIDFQCSCGEGLTFCDPGAERLLARAKKTHADHSWGYVRYD